jgi:hypothetical protein
VARRRSDTAIFGGLLAHDAFEQGEERRGDRHRADALLCLRCRDGLLAFVIRAADSDLAMLEHEILHAELVQLSGSEVKKETDRVRLSPLARDALAHDKLCELVRPQPKTALARAVARRRNAKAWVPLFSSAGRCAFSHRERSSSSEGMDPHDGVL